MSFVSILGVGEIKKTASVAQPDFFRDLNLNQVIDKIQEYAGDYSVKKYYYAFPMEEDVIYRQEIYQDIKNRELYERLMEFSSDMRKSAAKEVTETFSGEPLQGDSWQLESAYHYCKAIVELKETLDKGIEQKKYKSQGMQDLREFLEGIMKEKSFLEMSQDVFRIWDMFSNTHFTLEIMGNKVRISPKAQEGVYEDNLNECFKEYGTVEKGSMHSPFIGDVSLTRLERRLLQAFFGKYPQLEREIIKFAEKYQQFKNLQILQLEQELQFYLAYYRFQKEWEGMGAMFSKPNRNEESPMEALGVYDLALACMNYPANKVVVSNGYAKDIVNKYQLTYEALRDRLKGYAMPEGGDGNA